MTQFLKFRGCVKLIIHYFPKVSLSVVLLVWQAMEKCSFFSVVPPLAVKPAVQLRQQW